MPPASRAVWSALAGALTLLAARLPRSGGLRPTAVLPSLLQFDIDCLLPGDGSGREGHVSLAIPLVGSFGDHAEIVLIEHNGGSLVDPCVIWKLSGLSTALGPWTALTGHKCRCNRDTSVCRRYVPSRLGSLVGSLGWRLLLR